MADNHFSGDTITNYLGKNGFGYTCTTWWDWLPSDINKQYLNHIQQNDTSNSRLKVAQYEQLIVAVERVNSMPTTQAYTKVITSFQSTGTTNFTSVNSLPSCHLFVSKKEWGQGNDKQVWAIEYHKARQLYLSAYWAVDAADKMINFVATSIIVGSISTPQWDTV